MAEEGAVRLGRLARRGGRVGGRVGGGAAVAGGDAAMCRVVRRRVGAHEAARPIRARSSTPLAPQPFVPGGTSGRNAS